MHNALLQRRELHDFFYVSPPTFVIPVFRAPTTKSTTRTTTTTTHATLTSTESTFSTIFKQDKQDHLTTTPPVQMASQHLLENLVLTNTIVASFCIVLMIALTAFLIFLLIPSIRRRWLGNPRTDEKRYEELSALSRQPSFHQFTLGPARSNPIFEPAIATTTQCGTLFQPHSGTTTLLHPTVWAPMTATSILAGPGTSQPSQKSSAPPEPPRTKTRQTMTTTRPPLPTYPATITQKSQKK